MIAKDIIGEIVCRLPKKLIPDLQETIYDALNSAILNVVNDLKSGFCFIEGELPEGYSVLELPKETIGVIHCELLTPTDKTIILEQMPGADITSAPPKGVPTKYVFSYTTTDGDVIPILIFNYTADTNYKVRANIKLYHKVHTPTDTIMLPPYTCSLLVHYALHVLYSGIDLNISNNYLSVYLQMKERINKQYRQTPMVIQGMKPILIYRNVSDNP